MNAVKIAVAPAIPDFKFPEQYKPDIWDFKNWDYYKDSSQNDISYFVHIYSFHFQFMLLIFTK